MPRVSVFEGGNIAPPQTTGTRYQAPDYGPGIGRGVEQLGSALGQASEAVNQIGEMHDEASVKEATNAVNEHYAEIAYTGPNAFFDKQGKDALDLRPTVEKSLDETIKQRRAVLQNERQRHLFDDAVSPQRQQWGVTIASHAMKETRTYAATESAARAGMTAEMAGLTYIDDPRQGEDHLATMRAEIGNQGHILGWGPEQISAEQLKATSGVYQDIGGRLASEGQQGPELAREFVKIHGGSMTNDARERVLTNARVRQDALEAEQRRADAEQRRLANDVKRDARDRAQSAAANLDSGIPMKPEDMTQTIADAKASGDDALLKRIQVGQQKNSLTLEHQSDTPYQLQARINELSTDINKAGINAKPEKIIERDHLQTLLTNSRTQLHTDPFAWATRHLGIEVKPLVLGDPNSIRDRMSAVQTIRRQTGMPVAPLQPDEVSVAQGTFNSGTTQQKTDLVMKLAQFGPYAGDAAEQVTNNPAIIGVVGLATHSNRGVAASRVNQVVTGYDVLKTKPKLIDKDQAGQQFNQLVGGALQFLPQVRAGVLSNAQALLATQANEHGWNEWGDAQEGWQAAINSALGSYSRDGKRVGGLWNYNGGTTVLPENMTGTEFEDRIAKAQGPQFRSAQNGEPVYADGRNPTATDLKKMQWVPSGDGIYRLSDGNGFLHTKAGGFYEINVGKLNPVGGGPRLPFGMTKPGNIDIHNRPVVHNQDGSISTVRSISIGTDDGEVLIPTVVGGKVVSDRDAIAHFKRTGEHLGIFKDAKTATAYAKQLHEEQAQEYGGPISPANLARYGYTRR